MSCETVFEYRHKKFDQGKRSREDDSIALGNGKNSVLLDLSDSSKTSTSSTLSSKTLITISKKSRKVTRPLQRVTTSSRFLESTDTELPQRLQRININQYKNFSSPFSSTAVNYSLNGTVLAANDNRVVIKTEIIDEPSLNAVPTINGEVTSPKRRKTSQSTTPIKIEPPQLSPDVKIKEELIELNTRLPAIPKEAYEDICKFRSNMVRKFPKKERSVKEQERRDKNTYACRKSRRVKKIEQVAVEEEYKNFKDANLRMAEYAIRAAAYFKELMKMTEEASASEIIVVD